MSDNESERSQQEVDVPNVWAVTGDSNPYLHNFFSLFGIDPDGSQADYDYELDKASGLVDAGKISTAYGRPVNKSDVARGEDLAKTPVKFVAERLLAHSVHQLDVREFLPITRAIDKLPLDKPEDFAGGARSEFSGPLAAGAVATDVRRRVRRSEGAADRGV